MLGIKNTFFEYDMKIIVENYAIYANKSLSRQAFESCS